MGKHHGHAAGFAGHGLDHVLNPGEVAGFGWRQPGKVAAVGVVDPDVVSPLFQGEGRIGDHAVKGGEAVARIKGGQAQGVAAFDMEIFRAMEKEVHPGNGGCGQVLFLAIELAQHEILVAAMLFDIVQRLEEHAAGPAGRIIDGFPGLGRKDADHQRDHGARGIELTGLLVGEVGKFLDQVFIGLAENVRLAVLIAQVER
jgi:hypothetical protein